LIEQNFEKQEKKTHTHKNCIIHSILKVYTNMYVTTYKHFL
jgi:hypothetical protein